jgi:hypothetical protein
MKKAKDKKIPSNCYDFLIKTGMDESIALEIDEYTQQKNKRKKRIETKNLKDDKWK